jgi:serine/threonine-protein kinase
MKKRIDSRCDLFSLGVVAYEAATGSHPFAAGARDYLDILRRTETLVVKRPTINGDESGAIAEFVQVLMDKYPSRRPPTAALAREWFIKLIQMHG